MQVTQPQNALPHLSDWQISQRPTIPLVRGAAILQTVITPMTGRSGNIYE